MKLNKLCETRKSTLRGRSWRCDCVESKFCHQFKKKKNARLKLIDCWVLLYWNFSLKNEDTVLPAFINPVRSLLEYAAQFYCSHHARDISKLEAVQWTATMTTSLRNKSYKERLARINLLSLERNASSK